jgi:hypothetical protein
VPAARCRPATARVWKLTPEQLDRTARALLPGAGLAAAALRSTLVTEGGFTNAAHWRDMSEPHVEALFEATAGAAEVARRKPEALAACLGRRPVPAGCSREAVPGLLERAFRRAPEPTEVTAWTAFLDRELTSAGGDPGVAAAQVTRALLMSPHFLYRTELGPAGAAPGSRVSLTPYERASALSYLLMDGPPDATLLTAAREGRLATAAELEAQVNRLLAAADRAPGMVKVFEEWLAIENVNRQVKDPKRFPRWSDEIPGALVAETRAFVSHVLWEDGGSLTKLLTAPYSFLNDKLAASYGLPAVAGASLRQTPLPAGRRGVLMQGSVVAALANATDSDIVRRGKYLRERVLCAHLPEPPPNIPPIPPADGKSSGRERLARHSADPVCAGCHVLMDPLGFGLETLDAAGRLRAEDVGKPIDDSGTLTGTSAPRAEFRNGVEMVTLLAETPEVERCALTRLFAYGHGREPDEGDACAIDAMTRALRGSGGNLKRAVAAMILDESFFTRLR